MIRFVGLPMNPARVTTLRCLVLGAPFDALIGALGTILVFIIAPAIPIASSDFFEDFLLRVQP